MKRGRRFWAPQGWTVFRTWLHDIRPIRFLRLRLDERRGSVFPRQARARRAEAGKGGKGRGGPANAATGGDALVEMPQSLGARRPWSPLPTADHAPRAQRTHPWRLFPPRFTTSPAEAIACTCSFVASAAADR